MKEETKRKISLANKGKNNGMFGKTPWNKGLKVTQDERIKRFVESGHKKIKEKYNEGFLPKSAWNKGRTPWNKGKKTGIIPKTAFKKGERFNPSGEFKKGHIPKNYKGDKAGYFALHNWLKRIKGKAIVCSDCGSDKNVHWSNISFEYKRELDDWIEKCIKCHQKYDRKYGWGRATTKFPELQKR